MAYDEPDEDEDWCDEEADSDGVELGPCPECGAAVYDVSDRCPACGYWLLEDDLRSLDAGSSKPLWIRATVVIVLVAFAISALGLAAAFF